MSWTGLRIVLLLCHYFIVPKKKKLSLSSYSFMTLILTRYDYPRQKRDLRFYPWSDLYNSKVTRSYFTRSTETLVRSEFLGSLSSGLRRDDTPWPGHLRDLVIWSLLNIVIRYSILTTFPIYVVTIHKLCHGSFFLITQQKSYFYVLLPG